jgi:hypothetical protein
MLESNSPRDNRVRLIADDEKGRPGVPFFMAWNLSQL